MRTKPCYFKCLPDDGPLHSFPTVNPENIIEIERFEMWKRVLKESDCGYEDSYYTNNVNICHKHFEPYYRLPSRRLTKNAVPTLNLVFAENHNEENSREPNSIEETASNSGNVKTILHSDIATDNINSTDLNIQNILVNANDQECVMPKPFMLKELDDIDKIKMESQDYTVTEQTNVPDAIETVIVTTEETQDTTQRNILQESIIAKYYNKPTKNIALLEKEVVRLEKKYAELKKELAIQNRSLRLAKKLSPNKAMKLIAPLPHDIKTFIKLQLKNRKYVGKGKKFSRDEKMLGLRIFKESRETYHYFRKNNFLVPSYRSIKRYIDCGLDQTIYDNKQMSELDRVNSEDDGLILCDENETINQETFEEGLVTIESENNLQPTDCICYIVENSSEPRVVMIPCEWYDESDQIS